jgi:GNAT superfamily N-acetyltransferase
MCRDRAVTDLVHDGRVERFFTLGYEEHAELRDGTEIVVRMLRPTDRDLLREGFERLSPESRYARFFGPKDTLTDDELRYLCEIDQESHVAIGAATHDGKRGLGIARFIRVADGEAEAAIAVADEMQGRGLGRLLFLRLCAAARERGITMFKCEVLGTNAGMKHLLDAIGAERQIAVSCGVMTFDLEVPDVSPIESIASPAPSGAMYRLFRAAAEDAIDWTETIRNLWGRGRTSREQ